MDLLPNAKNLIQNAKKKGHPAAMGQIRICDVMARMATPSPQFGATLPADRVVLKGARIASRMASGLTINLHDARAEEDFETRNLRPANVVLHLVLSGTVEASVAGASLDMSRAGDQPARLVLSALARPAEFRRRVHRGEKLTKVTVVLDWDWLGARGVPRDAVLLGQDHRVAQWTASADDVSHAERLFALRAAGDGARMALQFASEALGMSLVQHAMEEILAQGDPLGPHQRDQLRRAERLATLPGPLPPLPQIAAAAGLSVSSLRRLFERAHGQTVLDRLRDLKMDRAAEDLRAGASVAEAAHVAGYGTPTAFATAFRKKKGVSPSRFAQMQKPT